MSLGIYQHVHAVIHWYQYCTMLASIIIVQCYVVLYTLQTCIVVEEKETNRCSGGSRGGKGGAIEPPFCSQ